MIGKDHLQFVGDDRLRRLATYASVAVATVLIVAKLIAYFMTDSVAMLSSLLDSTIDLLASIVTAYGVSSAMRPPDREHRFGYGKAEPLSALAQAAFIIGSSVLLGYEALSRFYHPHDIQNAALGYSAMAVAIVLTLVLLVFQRYVVRRTRSVAIHADHVHYIGDLGVNMAVVVAFGLYEWTGLSLFDPLFGIGIAAAMVVSALGIAKNALNVLMDRELPDEDRTKIKGIVAAQPHVRGMHDLRTRSDGDRIFIELHLELDADMTLRAAHAIDENLMDALRAHYPHSDIIIHQDPAGLPEDRLDAKIVRAERG